MLSTFNRLKIDPKKISICSLGCVESTLNINLITPHLKELFELFPNLKKIYLSSNFLSNIDSMIEFIDEINETAPEPIIIYFVNSIDGSDEMIDKHGHLGKWNIYYKNYKKIADYINNYTYKGLRCLIMGIYATMTKEYYLDYFSDIDNMIKYVNYWNETTQNLMFLFKSDRIRLSFHLPIIAFPYQFTADDVLKLKHIFAKWDSLKLSNLYRYRFNVSDDMLMSLVDPFGLFLISEDAGLGAICHACQRTINLLPDGHLFSCIDDALYALDYYADEVKDDMKEYHLSKVYSQINFAPIKMTDTECQEFTWKAFDGLHISNKLNINLMSGLIDELALSGQIPYKYYSDGAKKIQAIDFISNNGGCPRNCVEMTGLYHCQYAGKIKFLIGILDYAQELYKSHNHSLLTDCVDHIRTIYPTDLMSANKRRD